MNEIKESDIDKSEKMPETTVDNTDKSLFKEIDDIPNETGAIKGSEGIHENNGTEYDEAVKWIENNKSLSAEEKVDLLESFKKTENPTETEPLSNAEFLDQRQEQQEQAKVRWEHGLSPNEPPALKEDVRTDSTGNVYIDDYPENDGFEYDPEKTVLQPGTIIQREGSESGRFATTEGTPHNEIALPTEEGKIQRYEVVKPIEVWEGDAKGAHGDPGGAKQYEFRQVDENGKLAKTEWDKGEYDSEIDSEGKPIDDRTSIEELIEKGYLHPLDD